MTESKPKPKTKAKAKIIKGEARIPAVRPKGGQTLYTPEIANEICRRLATGESLRQICRSEGMPGIQTVLDWVLENRSDFAGQYARARELCFESWADEIVDIPDTATGADAAAVNLARLRVDSRKWLLSKLRPDRYGDSIKHIGSVATVQTAINISADELREIARKVAEEF